MVLAPLHDAARPRARARRDLPVGLRARAPTRSERLRARTPTTTSCAWTGARRRRVRRGGQASRGDAQDPRAPRPALERDAASRVPVVVGHAEAVWIETGEPLSPAEAERILAEAPGSAAREDAGARACARRRRRARRPGSRQTRRSENGLALFLICDNLRKGAALNAIQIAEMLVGASLPSYSASGEAPRASPSAAAGWSGRARA